MEIIITLLIIVFLVVLLFLLLYKFVFLRNPAREIPYGNSIVSPADGVISRIIHSNAKDVDIDKGTLGRIRTHAQEVGKNWILILIVMNIWHVHYQRAPIAGKVIYSKHKHGTFRNAVIKGASFRTIENERNEILIDARKFKVKMIQIAGIVARRIYSFVKKNDRIIKGQSVGLIKLGSQVALFLPANIKLKVKIDEPVKAGTTIIGEY